MPQVLKLTKLKTHNSILVNTTSIGNQAESLVALYLERELGHRILDRNWKCKYAEIDIISILDDCIYFTEVKYRSSSQWGTGLDYITSKKLKQMHFAAELWLSTHQESEECLLQAAAVDAQGQIDLLEL
jgi:ribonuclease HII